MAVLTRSQVQRIAQQTFGDLGPTYVALMTEIAMRESGGNTFAYNGEGMDRSRGLWQINTIAQANPQYASWDLENPLVNARAAREILDRQGPTAWSTYKPAAQALGASGGTKASQNVAPSAEARELAYQVIRSKFENLPAAETTAILNAMATAIEAGADPASITKAIGEGTRSPQQIIAAIGSVQQQAARDAGLRSSLGIGTGGTGAPEPTGNMFEDLRASQQGALDGLYDAFKAGTIGADEYLALSAQGIQNLDKLNQFERDGTVKLGDGSFITLEDLENADPLVRTQAQAALYQFGKEAIGNGNAFLAQMGLPTFDEALLTDPQKVMEAAQADFENGIAALREKVAVEGIGFERAAADIERQLGGMAESRARASMVTDQLIKAAPLATGGRSSFTLGEMGGGFSLLGQQAGLGPETAFNIPSQVSIDPEGLMRQGDAALGVSGPLRGIPESPFSVGDVPTAPDMQGLRAMLDAELAGAPAIVQSIPLGGGGEQQYGPFQAQDPTREPSATNPARQMAGNQGSGWGR